MTDSRWLPTKIYADGLQYAERVRQLEPPLKQDLMADAYSLGYFKALDDVMKSLVGHAPGSCEEKLSKLVLEIYEAAATPVELGGG